MYKKFWTDNALKVNSFYKLDSQVKHKALGVFWCIDNIKNFILSSNQIHPFAWSFKL